MILFSRSDLRHLLQQSDFDTIDFVHKTRALNLDTISNLLNECLTESKCELSDTIAAQYEAFIALYDDISLTGQDEMVAIEQKMSKLLGGIKTHEQECERQCRAKQRERDQLERAQREHFERNALASMQSMIDCIRKTCSVVADPEKTVFQCFVIEQIHSKSANSKVHELYADFKEELRVKLEQIAVKQLYVDGERDAWRSVCAVYSHLGRVDELVELFYKIRIQPLVREHVGASKLDLRAISTALQAWTGFGDIYDSCGSSKYHEAFIVGAVWNPVAEAVLGLPGIFSPTHQQRFHDSNVAVLGFVEFVEGSLVRDQGGLEVFRRQTTVGKLRDDWQYSVYFQLILRSSATRFEGLAAGESVEWGGVFKGCMDILGDVCGDRFFLKPLLAKTLQFCLQLLGRLRVAVLPKLVSSLTIADGRHFRSQCAADLHTMVDFADSFVREHVKDGRLLAQATELLAESHRETVAVLDSLVEEMPKLFVSKLMSGIEGVLRGECGMADLLTRYTQDLPGEERAAVLHEFALKFEQASSSFVAQAIAQEEHWRRLEGLSLDDSEMTDLRRPEPSDSAKQRVRDALETLSRYLQNSTAGTH